jgi:hypothetical protein
VLSLLTSLVLVLVLHQRKKSIATRCYRASTLLLGPLPVPVTLSVCDTVVTVVTVPVLVLLVLVL